ncbi:MAG: class I SAM-dependent methyltransferase [Rhodobacteraceae bacterium]|nr:class I SAM-dependent methyltransferase [Paracoccaceae bacterium]PHQ71243.1 MAG: hypothetical protein COB93_03635 [Sneathiella sp.]
MKEINSISGYAFASAAHSHAHSYLLPYIDVAMAKEQQRLQGLQEPPRLFDLGCGNGSVAAHYARAGWQITGVDPSEDGIAQAQRAFGDLDLGVGSAYEDLEDRFGRFPLVISLEVVEHVYAPRDYAKTLFSLVEPGGLAIVSTPYHGYVKNVALAVTGKLDNHFTALWAHGHIKFWSMKTLGTLLKDAGFEEPSFGRVGRIPPFAKSMIAFARRPVQG